MEIVQLTPLHEVLDEAKFQTLKEDKEEI